LENPLSIVNEEAVHKMLCDHFRFYGSEVQALFHIPCPYLNIDQTYTEIAGITDVIDEF